ncbi:unnamed protein product [Mytilus edulis]|uniref:B box-type domain-containing protein n=1 Tax=Mytilus edulis TaxID=6550 RepID=A0A8S3TBN8_MYTED|nr:unnamed protein product [Mytilus edulis]
MSDNYDCEPCQMQDILKSSTNWCTTCEEGLWDNCNIHHKANKASRSHTTIAVGKLKSLDPFVSSLNTTCDVHDLPLELFCPNHEAPCCSSCAANIHSTCLGITSFQKVIQEANNSNQIDDINAKLDDLLSQVDIMIKNRKDNKTKIIDQAGNILENQLQSKSDNLITLETGAIENVVKRLKVKRHDIDNLKNNILNLKDVGSNAQKYIGGKKAELTIGEENKILASLADNSDMAEVSLEFTVDPMTEETIMKSIDVYMKNETEIRNQRKRFLHVRPFLMKLPFCRKFFDTSVFDRHVTISSIVVLPWEEVIVSAYSRYSVVVFSPLGTMEQTIPLMDAPFDLYTFVVTKLLYLFQKQR